MSAVIADKATKKCPLGQHVIATWKGSAKYYIGYVIEKVKSNRQKNRGCKVLFDDGDMEWYKPKDLRVFPDHTSPLEGTVFFFRIRGNASMLNPPSVPNI